MTFYELLKTIHVLSIATWFGSGVAITVIGLRTLRAEGPAFSSFAVNAGWWAGRAHPAAGVLLLLTGFGMIGDADISIGEPWIIIAIVGLVAAMALGGAVIGKTSAQLMASFGAGGGSVSGEQRGLAERLLMASRIEIVILVIVIADMVIKPG